MRVHFIDTSVFLNILGVPGRSDEREKVMPEFIKISESKNDVLVLPYATIIETGNHIAHNGDGRQRRETAQRFAEALEKTIQNKAPWHYYGRQLTEEDIHEICIEFPNAAMQGEGFGDLSIIRAYKRYKEEIPGIEEIRIWTLDKHLASYRERVSPLKGRNN